MLLYDDVQVKNMDSQKISYVRCPQCGNVCKKTLTPLTDEHSIECHVCGYQEVKTIKDIQKFKGYGSLVVNDTTVLFHNPISFEKEQEILKSISGNPNATFIKWTDEFELTVLKGELPQELTDEEEERIKELMNENEYYDSLRAVPCDNSNLPFFCT